MEIIDQIISNKTTSTILLILGLLLTILGIILTIKSKKTKRFNVYNWHSREILSGLLMKSNNIKITHLSKEVKNLYQLKVGLKNNGKNVIKIEDFHQKPYIDFHNIRKILSVDINGSKDYIEPKVLIEEDHKVLIDFCFLEPRDIINIKILYDSDYETGGTIKAKIVGGNLLDTNFRTNLEEQAWRHGKTIGQPVYMFIILLLLLLGTTLMKKLTFYKEASLSLQTIIFVIFIFLSASIGLGIGVAFGRMIAKKQIKRFVKDGLLSKKEFSVNGGRPRLP